MDRKTIIDFVNQWDSEASCKIVDLMSYVIDEYDVWNADTVDDIVTFCLEWIEDARYDYSRELEGTEGPISTLYRYEVWEQMEMILNKVKAEYGNPE